MGCCYWMRGFRRAEISKRYNGSRLHSTVKTKDGVEEDRLMRFLLLVLAEVLLSHLAAVLVAAVLG